MTAAPLPTDRAALLERLAEPRKVDLVVVGGGATGLGVALDAALRGHSVVLLEAEDFAKGTSSRATKLVHGGVRYLAQGNVGLVREALHERVHILENAPHLAQPLPFVMPAYRYWETPFYGVGLKMYDLLAGRAGLGDTRFLSPRQTQRLLPGVQARGLKGGVKYWDGQFDDARLALAIARTAAAQGALLVNYCRVTGVLHEAGKVAGVHCQDTETGREFELQAGCVVNATGVWVDALREDDARAAGQQAQPMVAPSQGVHAVVDQDFSPGGHALLVPSTADGRVLFAVPWQGKLILGTTDTPRQDVPLEPRPLAGELEFILREAGHYLARAPQRADIRSVWVGLTAGQADARGWGYRRHQPRTHGAGFAGRPGHGDRRQVDHLPRHGRGRAGPLRGGRAPARPRPFAHRAPAAGGHAGAGPGSGEPGRATRAAPLWGGCERRTGVAGKRHLAGAGPVGSHGALCRPARIRPQRGRRSGAPFALAVPGCCRRTGGGPGRGPGAAGGTGARDRPGWLRAAGGQLPRRSRIAGGRLSCSVRLDLAA